ncbi:uncharacterized protein LOC126366306 isoform X2 [Pectinophora gossypiella]|uniref:uncharacterized protein LOC126366306 isoform X2 n=1 Tax=Pectinophora gossypiella TaxID=13191 RepID=UPI00214E41C9|nr:uncharacterized protein LOC126366306 isoform X2 [Pectinophora gossypiella]
MCLVRNLIFVGLLFRFWTRIVAELRTLQIGDTKEFHCCGRFPRGGTILWYQRYDNNHTFLQSTETYYKCGSEYNGRSIKKIINVLDHNTDLYCIYWEKEKAQRTRRGYISNSIHLQKQNLYSTKYNYGSQQHKTNRGYVTITPTNYLSKVGTAVNYTCELHNMQVEDVELYQEKDRIITAYTMTRQTFQPENLFYHGKIITENDNNSKIYCVATLEGTNNFVTSTKSDLIVETSIQTNQPSDLSGEENTNNDNQNVYLLSLILSVILICLIVAGLVIFYKRRKRPPLEAQSDAVTYAELYIRPPASGNVLKEDSPQYAQIVGFLAHKKK